jgi:hypothetical protein
MTDDVDCIFPATISADEQQQWPGANSNKSQGWKVQTSSH